MIDFLTQLYLTTERVILCDYKSTLKLSLISSPSVITTLLKLNKKKIALIHEALSHVNVSVYYPLKLEFSLHPSTFRLFSLLIISGHYISS